MHWFKKGEGKDTCHYQLVACMVTVHLGAIAKQPDLARENITECLTSGADLLSHAYGIIT